MLKEHMVLVTAGESERGARVLILLPDESYEEYMFKRTMPHQREAIRIAMAELLSAVDEVFTLDCRSH